MDDEFFRELGERVLKFTCLELPGQPRMMHMGTCGLVDDLWNAVKKLREEVKNLTCAAMLDSSDKPHWSQQTEEIYSSEIQQNNGSDNGALSEPIPDKEYVEPIRIAGKLEIQIGMLDGSHNREFCLHTMSEEVPEGEVVPFWTTRLKTEEIMKLRDAISEALLIASRFE